MRPTRKGDHHGNEQGKRGSKKATTVKPAAYSDTTAQYTGANADWNIDPLPVKERVAPRDGSLRAQALAKMQKGGVTHRPSRP